MFDQFKNMKQLAGMLGNLGDMRQKAEQLREELARRTVVADAGAGAVTVEMSGTFEVRNVTIDPAMLSVLVSPGSTGTDENASAGDDDRQMVEELLVAAFNAALEKAQELVREETARLTGGMNLPGM